MTNTSTLSITSKQLLILNYLLRFRFLTRIHIQTILNHKHPGQINKWLKELSDKHIIFKIYSKTFPDNVKPAIYCLDKKSIVLLNTENTLDTSLIKRIYKDKKRSNKFVTHSMVIADLFIQLNQKYKQLYFYTKTELREFDFLIKPSPDIYLVAEDIKAQRFFIDIFDSDTPRFVLRNRIKRFIEYFISDEWLINTSFPFPSVVLICQNESMKKYLEKHIEKIIEEEGNPKINFIVSNSLPLL